MERTNKHFHAIGGLRGCMPSFNEICDCRSRACDTLRSIFELNRCESKTLNYFLYIDLDIHHHGAEYCEVNECNNPVCEYEEILYNNEHKINNEVTK